MRWLMRLVRGKRLDRDLDRELQFHVDEETSRLVADGVPVGEARRRALATFGGVEPMKEYARDARGTRWIQDAAKDLRYTGRVMRRHAAFTVTAVVSLGLAIGANAAIFSVTDALLLKSLPVDRPHELVFFNRGGYDNRFLLFSTPLFERFSVAMPGHVAGSTYSGRLQVIADGPAELMNGQLVTGNWFGLLGVGAAAGRVLTESDVIAGSRAPVAVLSHGVWFRRFAANPAVVGTSVRVNGLPVTIAGVAPPGFDGVTVGDRVDMWLPVSLQHDVTWRGNANVTDADDRKPWMPQEGIAWLGVVARVPAAMPAAQAEARFGAVMQQDVERRAASISDATDLAFARRERLELLPGARGMSSLRENFSAPLYVLMATAAIVLLIGCANLASLLLARGTARSREFALRLSLGARRGRLVRQMLTESVALAGLGGAVALGVAMWGSTALLQLASSSGRAIPLNIALDWRLLVFTAGVSVITGLAFGLAPAVRLSRADLADAMKPGGRVTGDVRRPGQLPFGRILVAGQVAMSLALLVGAVLFLRTFSNLLHVDSGFDRTRVVSARFDPRLAQIPPDRMPALYERLLDEARRLPGVERVSIAMSGAVTGSNRMAGIVVKGQPRRRGQDGVVREEFIGADYFQVMGMTIVKGRDFSTHDTHGKPDVVLINETMARAFFADTDPIGKRLGYDEPAEMEIVGVVRDALIDGLRQPPPRLVYHALRQHPEEAARNLYARVSGSPVSVKAMMAQAVARAEPGLAVREVVTMDELTARTVANERLVSRLTGAFGVLAVLVACLGLYGTISYSVARRTGEIGVRIALGATPGRVMRQVLGETAWLVGAGTLAGVVLALGLMGYTATLLYGLSPRDPVTLAGSALVLVVIGVLAGLVPARRAANVDPLQALRLE